MTSPVASFELKDGTQLTLYADRVIHEGGGNLEILPLAHLASVRVGFERDQAKLNWAVVLLVIALLLLLAWGPLLGWSASASARVAEGARRESLDAVLHAAFGAVTALARLLPWISALLGAIAAALAATFVVGATVLTLSIAAAERSFVMRGRDRQLVEFAEVIGEQLAPRAK